MLSDVEKLLSTFGHLTNFWMDSTKRNCLCSYKSEDEAKKAWETLDGVEWPRGGSNLEVQFVNEEEFVRLK